jgi:hypothetical protein
LDRQLFQEECEKFRNSEDRINFQIGELGIPVGRLGFYETSLKFKKDSLSLGDEKEVAYHQIMTENAIAMGIAAQEIMSAAPFDALVVYSPQYGGPGSVAWVAENLGIRVFFMEGSSALSEKTTHVRIWDWGVYGLDNPRFYDFDSTARLSIREVKRVDSHLREIKNASSYSVYSKKFDSKFCALDALGIPKGAHAAVLTMSSSDEALAAISIDRFPLRRLSSTVFEDQLHWLAETIAWFSQHPEYFLAVRPHPRDFPTKREPTRAKHIEALGEILSNLPDNVRIDRPDSGIPMWSYFSSVRVLITGWSSTGLEALINGVQVVTYDSELSSFPATLGLTGKTAPKYFENLSISMETSGDKEQMRDSAKMWLHHNLFSSTLKLSPPLFSLLARKFPVWRRANTLLDRLFPKWSRRIDMHTFRSSSIDNLGSGLERFISNELQR